jgi:murein DD-endopeptidase MepM/ murein hydrolase activator NlpD
VKIGWQRIKPGWYLLGLLLLYALVMTVAFTRANSALRELQAEPTLEQALEPESPEDDAPTIEAPPGLWFPIAGASIPENPAYLPGAPRTYRRGVSEGFTFYDQDAGVPIPYGTPVLAAHDAVVVRADHAYSEITPEAWEALIAEVGESGADEAQLDLLRGRQLWLELPDGRLLRYGHLAAIAQELAVGSSVYRGQVVGYVGNSGTEGGVRGSDRGARLHFEVRLPDGSFWGEGLDAEAVAQEAVSLFVGP